MKKPTRYLLVLLLLLIGAPIATAAEASNAPGVDGLALAQELGQWLTSLVGEVQELVAPAFHSGDNETGSTGNPRGLLSGMLQAEDTSGTADDEAEIPEEGGPAAEPIG